MLASAYRLSSSGSKTKRGASQMRKQSSTTVAYWGAHTYKHKANISRRTATTTRRTAEIVDIAWHAQQRLCRRYQRLLQRQTSKTLSSPLSQEKWSAYIWAIAREVVVKHANLIKHTDCKATPVLEKKWSVNAWIKERIELPVQTPAAFRDGNKARAIEPRNMNED